MFLQHVIPWEAGTFVNVHAFALKADGKLDPRSSRACTSLGEALNFVGWCDSMGWEVYFCVSSQKNCGIQKPNKRGGIYAKALRGVDNAAWLKIFFLDIDVKPGGYNTQQEAVDALMALCAVLGIPLPTIVVYSGGGGLHVYWVLDQAMPPDEWRLLAARLADACRTHGLKADHNVTVNTVCILRVPGTHNRKYGAPRPVTSEILGGTVSRETFEQALAGYSDAAALNSSGTQPGEISTTRQDLTNFPIKAPFDPSDWTGGIFSDAPPTLDEVAEGCPFIKETLATGGKGQSEPLWFAAGHVALFTKDELADFHRLSNQHADYVPAETDAKFARIRDHKLVTDQGWPRCATIALHASQCATCPHRAENKSPLNFAVRKPSEPEVTQGGSPSDGKNNPQGAVNSGDKKFRREVKGYICHPTNCTYSVEVEKDGVTSQVLIWEYPMWNLDRLVDDNNLYSLHFDTLVEHNTWAHITLPVTELTQERIQGCLQGRFGLGIRPDQLRGLLTFMASFQQQMAALKLQSTNQETMGWSNDSTGEPVAFIFGDTKYNCKGNSTFYQPDRIIKDLYFPTGSMEPWKQAIAMVNGEKRPEADLLVATAFAAPLMRFTGHSVVVSAYSSASAVHKSTCLKVGQAVWGSARAINQLTDTENAIIARADKAKVVPLYFDEMKAATDVDKFYAMTYTFVGGRGKARLNRNAEIKDVGTWDTMLVGASNGGLVSHVASKDKNTEAGVNRIFEFEVGPPMPGVGQISMGEAGKIIKSLEANYGHAGKIYSEKLGRSVEWLPDRVKQMVDLISKDLGNKSDERFWIAAAATLLVGAHLANEVNLTRFDVDAMYEFIKLTFNRMRGVRAFGDLDISQEDNVLKMLQGYLNSNRRMMLITNTVNVPPGRRSLTSPIVKIYNLQEANMAQQLAIQYAGDDKILRISRRHLVDCLTKNGAPAVHVIGNLMKYFQAVERTTHIGPGTDFKQAKERLIELDLSNPKLIDLFDV